MEEHEEIYHASPLEILMKEHWTLQRRQELGEHLEPELEKNWDEIKGLIESADEVKLENLRQDVVELRKKKELQ